MKEVYIFVENEIYKDNIILGLVNSGYRVWVKEDRDINLNIFRGFWVIFETIDINIREPKI